ncbi:MAG: nitroreductase family protein [Bacteroidales bacterium]
MNIPEIILNRWSPRAFSTDPIPAGHLRGLLEAARLAPSSMNEQPWLFFVGHRADTAWQKMFDTLVEFNKLWAHRAPVLIMAAGRKTYTVKNIGFNDAWAYDTGQAVAYLSLTAMHLGIYTHQMGGFDKVQAAQLFKLPEDVEPLTIIALGYKTDASVLPPQLAELEKGPKPRRVPETFIFGSSFGEPYLFQSK